MCVWSQVKSFSEQAGDDHSRVETSDERRRSRYNAYHECRSVVPVGRVAPIVSSALLTSRWLPVPSFDHLLMKYGSLGFSGKSAAAAEFTAPPYRRHAPDVECDQELCLNMTTSPSRQRHLLINLQQRLQRSCIGRLPVAATDLYIHILDTVPLIHVVGL